MDEPGAGEGFSYDVALSYAQEDREYVERVARAIQGRVRVFYDRHEHADLWGKNLYTHLAEVYGRKSRFCVMFISKHYASKVWTNHERESAQARAFNDNETYVLPARFDDTEIPGVLPTTGSVDLRSLTPEEFGALIIAKVRAPGMASRRVAGASSPSPAPSRRWLTLASATVVAGAGLGWAGMSLVSEAGGQRGAGTVLSDAGRPASPAAGPSRPEGRSPGGKAEQVVRSDGAGSTVVLDGGLRMRRRGGGDARQEASAVNGGTTIINGGMDYDDSETPPAPPTGADKP